MIALGLALLLAAQGTSGTDPLTRARQFLAATQQPDGGFPVPRHATDFRSGISALAALALEAGGDATHRRAAERTIAWLARQPRPEEPYALAYVARALCRGAPTADATRAAVAEILARQTEDGAWNDRSGMVGGRPETCLTAEMLLTLRVAQERGIDPPAPAIARGLRWLEQRHAGGVSMYHAELWPSPSYAATALAALALLRWGRGEELEVKNAVRWLERQPLGEAPSPPPSRSFRGYLRGRRLFELMVHSEALRAAGASEPLVTWRQKLRERLLARQREDGAFEGWYGRTYGTALVLLALAAEG